MLRFRKWLEVRRLRKKSCLKYRQGRRQFARRVEKIERKYRRMRAAWAAMNAMYSDYFGIAKKYNVNTPEFYADMAMAFIHDKDAKPNKVARYYAAIAKK